MKKKCLCAACAVMLLLSLLYVWHNSAATGEESGSASGEIAERVAPIAVPDFQEKAPEEKKEIVSKTNSIVRNFAHTAEFVPVGFFAFLFLFTCGFKRSVRAGESDLPDPTPKFSPSEKDDEFPLILWMGVSFLIGFLSATGDEIHQLYVPGRGFEWSDIARDSAGVLAGCLVAFTLVLIVRAWQKRHPKEEGMQ